MQKRDQADDQGGVRTATEQVEIGCHVGQTCRLQGSREDVRFRDLRNLGRGEGASEGW